MIHIVVIVAKVAVAVLVLWFRVFWGHSSHSGNSKALAHDPDQYGPGIGNAVEAFSSILQYGQEDGSCRRAAVASAMSSGRTGPQGQWSSLFRGCMTSGLTGLKV